ncbi:MAG: hypothetical protein OEZ39_19780 [Gammaproteobacteria bacterium]|nr:hypothetical protein [Gammaproteobacteria bacterium]MDH5654108.1 hypothetical protein [Gammaproteobacteria bacterium]
MLNISSRSALWAGTLLCLVLSGCIPAPTYRTKARNFHYGMHCYQHAVRFDKQLKQTTWDVIKQYSPEGRFMIDTHREQTRKVCGVESEHFVSFIKPEKKDLNYYISLTTSVHEMAHNFTSMMPASRAKAIRPAGNMQWVYLDSPYGELAYYLSDKGVVFVPNTPTWPAREMDGDVPAELKEFTYKQYIIGQHGSNVIGVYALLDEFHAYYHDHQMSERMLRSKTLDFFEPGDYLNFLFFKYYILAYLEYGRRHHQGMYQDILANRAFVQTFLDIHDRFEKLHRDHLAYRKLHNIDRGKGQYIHHGKTIVYPGLDKTYAQLTRALDQPALKQMMQTLRQAWPQK